MDGPLFNFEEHGYADYCPRWINLRIKDGQAYICTQTIRGTLSNMFDVAILGFGPTGSTLANLLGCWSARHQKPISVLVRIKLTYRLTHQDG